VDSRPDEAEHSAKLLHEINESVKQIRDAAMHSQATWLRFDQQSGYALEQLSLLHLMMWTVGVGKPTVAAFAETGRCRQLPANYISCSTVLDAVGRRPYFSSD